MTRYYIGFENGGPQTYADGMPKARVKAVELLKKSPSEIIYIENSRTGMVEGKVRLNWKGIGEWNVGRTAWLISKNGDIYNKGTR